MDIAQYILDFVNQTHRSIFLTGKAGTGKTTLLHQIIATTYKNVMVAAPTGIAALNAKGVTLHSLFQLPLATFVPSTVVDVSLMDILLSFQSNRGKSALVLGIGESVSAIRYKFCKNTQSPSYQ